MGYALQPQPVKFILPMLSREPALFEVAYDQLSTTFGPIDYSSTTTLPFDHTTYYEGEFGSGLQRLFVAFERLIDPGQLAEIKLQTNSLEQNMAVDGRRTINLDPGYLSLAKFVLATTKDQGHRIYIGHGIYAEITLFYQRGEWRAHPWTYPDYQSAPYLHVFNELRGVYMDQLRKRAADQ